MQPTRPLPAAFADLLPFVADWALATEEARFRRLHGVTLAQLRPFYDAMLPRMDAVLDHLNRYDVDALPPEARTLFELSMTFAETAHPIDLKWRDVDFNDAYPWQKFEFRSVSCRSGLASDTN
jgi:hypothetical protein